MAFKLADLFVQITGNTSQLGSTLAGVKNQLLGIGAMGAMAGKRLAEGLAMPLLGISNIGGGALVWA